MQDNQNYQASAAPVGQLKTNRGLLKYILLSFITFGIYGIVVMSSISNDINIVASRYDGKKDDALLTFVLLGRTHYIRHRLSCLVPQNFQQNRLGTDAERNYIFVRRIGFLALERFGLTDYCRSVYLCLQII